MGYHIKTDGTITEVKPKDGQEFSLEELQGYVGGHIELLDAVKSGIYNDSAALGGSGKTFDIPQGSLMFLNENGKFARKVIVNEIANRIIHREWLTPGDVIVGDVLVALPGETS